MDHETGVKEREMDVTYNPASLRPKMVTNLHGLRIQLSMGIPDDAMLAIDDDKVVLMRNGILCIASLDAVREAFERENIPIAAQHMAASVQHAATSMAEVMAFFAESE